MSMLPTKSWGGLPILNVLRQLNYDPTFLYETLVTKQHACNIIISINTMLPSYFYPFVNKSTIIYSIQQSHIHLRYIQHSHIYTEYNVETHPRKKHKVLFIWHDEIYAPFVCTLSYRLYLISSSIFLQTLPTSHAL